MFITLLEIAGSVFGFASTVLLIRRNIGGWPLGIITVLLLGFVFYETKLYSAVLLQLCYLILQIRGWITWIRKGNSDEEDELQRATPQLLLTVLLFIVLGTFVLGRIMYNYSDASLPYWDALSMLLYIIGQWLIIHKVVECWYLWCLANVVTTVLYASQGLYYVALLHLIYIAVSLSGLLAWNRSYQEAKSAA